MNRATKVGAAIAMIAIGATAAFLLFAGDAEIPTALQPEPEPEPVYWPLTGEEAPDAAAIEARAVSVKIDNAAAARPQAGLADADVVYESLAEGGIPRFNAIYHSSAPERVGPIRSARLADLSIVPAYRALFAFSGANQTVNDRIAAAGIGGLSMERDSALYERDSGRSAPHNVYASIVELRAAAADAAAVADGGPRGLLFGDVPAEVAAGDGSGSTDDVAGSDGSDTEAAAAPGVTTILIPFSGGNDARWTWDAGTGRWLRDVAGSPHADEGTETRYAAANVIVMYAEMRETGMRDSAGSAVLDIRLDGEGDAVLLRDGRRYDVRWSAFADAPPRFETAGGVPFPLAVGRTWIEVVPPGHGVVIE